MRRLSVPAAFFAGAVVVASAHGCSSGEAPVARFELAGGTTPSMLHVPFPSDAYLENGHIMDPIPGFDEVFTQNGEMIERELAEMDGFSRITHALFWVDDLSLPVDDTGAPQPATIDQASLPFDETACTSDTSSVYLVDLQATGAAARVPCRAYFQDDRDIGSEARPVVAVGPARGVVLDEGHRYAAVLTNRLRTKGGRAVAASASFGALSSVTSPDATQKLYQDSLAQAKQLLGGALADGTRIVSIAPFTTHTRTRDLFQLRATLEAEPVPPLSFAAPDLAPMGAARFAKPVNNALPAGFTASLDDWLGVVDPKNVLPDGNDDWDNQLPVRAHNKIAAWGTAVFDASNYLVQVPGGWTVPSQAHFVRDASGNIIKNPDVPTYKIWVSIAVPDAPMPPGGYPTVIIQHGMSASREYVMQVSNLFCSHGWMVVGIDSITFGARALDPQYQVDQATDYENAPGATYKGPDGIADNTPNGRDPPTDLFANFQNLGAFRDHLREAAIDTAQLFRVLASDPDLSALQTSATAPHIDPNAIAYIGESLGSIEGEMAAAIEPRIKSWIFSVGGGGFIMEAAVHGPGIGALLGAAAGLYFHFLHDRLTEFHPVVNLVQMTVESADPLLYARDLLRDPQPVATYPKTAHNVLLLECLYDELVANEAGESWAREAGLVLASPNVGSNADVVDLKSPSTGRWHVPLQSVTPDGAGTIHDVPSAGLTGVVFQSGPCDHGSDWVSSKGSHNYAIPYVRYDQPQLYTKLDTAFDMRNRYRDIGAQFVQFLTDAFAGKVPGVSVQGPGPLRDYDDDGTPDDVDPDPNNPAVH
ncbi:MAG TPA: hypothetical protein VLM85_18680 [Polyangiaceae bacterium]|nr:hypothetical protein [Polyangiaceae bacterium]